MTAITETALLGWLAFAAGHLGLPVPAELPTIRMVAPETLQTLHEPNATSGDFRLRAVYLPRPRPTIYMSSEWKARPVWVSLMVHELAHHVQYQAGAHVLAPCGAALEADAYRVQFAYLERVWGLDPAAEIGITTEQIAELSSCN